MAATIFEFGDFKLDCGRFELSRKGCSVRLERKPLELLILLAESDGQLVTREEIARRLWATEVFVDTEHGINTAISKIRQTLRDDPEQPRFVLTVTGKGYRFIPSLATGEAEPNRQSHVAIAAGNGTSIPESTKALVDTPTPIVQQPASQAIPTPQPSPATHRKAWLVGIASLVVLCVALALGYRLLYRPQPQPAISSLAVLPLDNLSGDPNQDYFADGMTDELTTELARISALRVVSRTSVMPEKGRHRPLRQIAHDLNVDAIVEGSVVRSGDRIRITAQLIDTRSDKHLWAQSFEGSSSDVLALQDNVAHEIAAQTKAALAPDAGARTTASRRIDPAAHDAFLRGRYLWLKEKNEEAGKYFKLAVQLQPDYALGWTGLAAYYDGGAVQSGLNPKDALPMGEAAAARAVELDNSLAQAHLSIAASDFVYRWDWARADQEVLRAIELDPKYSEAYHLRAKILSVLGRNDEAIRDEKISLELDPFAKPWTLADAYNVARQYDAALEEIRQRLVSLPTDVSLFFEMYDAYRCKGMHKEAAQALAVTHQLEGNPSESTSIEKAFRQGGYNRVIHWQLGQFRKASRAHYVSPVEMAGLYAQLGDREKTLALLEEGFEQRAPLLLWIQTDPAYDFLHSDPRYRSLVKRIGLPPAY